MRRREILAGSLVVALGLCVVIVSNSIVSAQSVEKPLDWLSLESLQNLGVHLPSYLPTVQAQMTYQASVPLHQTITVKWSSHVGGQQAGSPGFVLVKRVQHVQKNAHMDQLRAEDRPILVVATTPGGEVRAVALNADTRSTSGEIRVQLPQDGQIARLIFARLVAGSDLQRIGEIDLGMPDGAPRKASK
jgi:hypothetical protein